MKLLCNSWPSFMVLRCVSELWKTDRHYKLRRRMAPYDVNIVREKIREEINGPACMAGYRSIWHMLRFENIQVPRRVVSELMRELDPEGCQQSKAWRLQRRKYFAPGPNYVWHVAGYDMLKPYGFLIHGFIGGWSRKFMWLKVTRSNNHHPDIVGNFYLGCLWSRRLPSQTEDWLWHGEWSDGSNGVHLWRGCPCAQVWIIAGQSENRGLVGIL